MTDKVHSAHSAIEQVQMLRSMKSEQSCHPACLETSNEENKHTFTWQLIEVKLLIILIYCAINGVIIGPGLCSAVEYPCGV